jgi:hypothetical protein
MRLRRGEKWQVVRFRQLSPNMWWARIMKLLIMQFSPRFYYFLPLRFKYSLFSNTINPCSIWGSHGGEYEDGCLLGCSTVQSGRSLPTFQSSLLPPSSGRWWAIGDRPDDGDSKDFWYVGKRLPDYTALQPRRQPSSQLIYVLPSGWENIVFIFWSRWSGTHLIKGIPTLVITAVKNRSESV